MAPTQTTADGHERSRWRSLRLALLGLLAAAVAIVGGCNGYILLSEHFRPSGRVYVVDSDGKRVELVRSTQPATPSAPTPVTDAALLPALAPTDPVTGPGGPGGPARQGRDADAPNAVSRRGIAKEARPGAPAVLPPVRLAIPSIAVDARVVLANNDNLPRFPGIGWYSGTAYPATVGNVVMFGHLDGPHATLGRLSELRPGEGIYVATRRGVHSYTVSSSRVVDRFDTSVMAPSRDARLTLITCAGAWLPDAGTYDRRLVVIAEYSGRVEAPRGEARR